MNDEGAGTKSDEATELWRAKTAREERARARAERRALPALAVAIAIGVLLMAAGLWIVAFR